MSAGGWQRGADAAVPPGGGPGTASGPGPAGLGLPSSGEGIAIGAVRSGSGERIGSVEDHARKAYTPRAAGVESLVIAEHLPLPRAVCGEHRLGAPRAAAPPAIQDLRRR